MNNAAQISLFKRISDGLQRKPAYLLIFGVAALFVLSGLANSATAIVRGELAWAVVALISFAVALSAAVIVVRQVEPQREQDDDDVIPPVELDVPVVDERLDRQAQAIRSNVQRAAGLGIQLLTEEVGQELNELALQSQVWSRGELHSDVNRYRTVLIQLYEHAQRSIFSTTNRDYLADWDLELMARMIEASEKAGADHVTRVFIFDNHNDLDSRAINVLRSFADSRKVATLVYFNDEDQGFHFPPDVSRDFVVIDEGEAIGVTLSYGPGNLRAQWYFGDEDRKERFERICRRLRRGCEDVDEVLSWWENRQ